MKRKYLNIFILLLIVGVFSSCTGNKKTSENMDNKYERGSFGYDLSFLSEKDDSLVVLKSDDGRAQLLVSARYQAKVFTSTAVGEEGAGHGFVNYKFFEAGVVDEHMNGFGGENRFWLGPEGGRYSIYFAPGTEQVFDFWHTPKAIDIETWKLVASSSREVLFGKEMQLKNYLGNSLNLTAERKISLLSDGEIAAALGIALPEELHVVAYSTDNKITNRNDFEWTPETGTVCIWMLDMFNPSDSAVTVIPYHAGDPQKLGKVVTSDYFGEIPAERLVDSGETLFFKTDGKFRSKLGLNARRSKAVAGNYDPMAKRLTVVLFDVDKDAVYLSQEWNPEKDPLAGDALNAYNDGPLDDGSIMGPFFELESCSPAAFLKPGESLSHRHSVFHFVGEESLLSPVCEKLLGVSIEKIKTVF